MTSENDFFENTNIKSRYSLFLIPDAYSTIFFGSNDPYSYFSLDFDNSL